MFAARRLTTTTVIASLLLSVVSAAPANAALQIVFDYSYDTGFFTGNSAARDRLEQAASFYESLFADDLAAIVPGTVYNQGTPFEFADTWTASFANPSTGGQASIVDLTIPADQIIVYAGARNLTTSLGIGGPGGYNTSGVANFNNTVATRGESGADTTDFGPWGGSIAFDTSINIASDVYNWHFGATTAGLDSNEFDFLSVAVHELGHLLGFGTAPSWDYLVTTGATTGTPGTGNATRENFFHGAASMSVNGGEPVPLEDSVEVQTGPSTYVFTDPGHWMEGLFDNSLVMDPTLTNGERKLLTALDIAGFMDLGWSLNVLPGDANNDGVVDNADFLAVEQNFGAISAADGLLIGDANDDGRVDGADFLFIQEHFGDAFAPLSTPEPATLLLLVAGAASLGCRRRG